MPAGDTSPRTPSRATSDVVVERLAYLQKDVTELKTSFSCFSGQLERLERTYLVEHEKLVGKVDSANARIDSALVDIKLQNDRVKELTNNVDALERSVSPLVTSNKIMAWIGSALGLSVIALLWMLLTGQVQLIFR